MQGFIDDTDVRINKTIQTLVKPNLTEEDRKLALDKLNDLCKLRGIYTLIQERNRKINDAELSPN